jgi:hypothetical protein
VARPNRKLESLRTRVRVAMGKPDKRAGYRWNRLGHPKSESDWRIHRAIATVDGFRRQKDWDGVERFCFFVGYGRSGHSLVGSLLNAHPDMVISHELGVIPYIEHGFTRNQLFSALLRRDRDFGSIGRTWTDYEYAVPNQYQGSFRRLRVIGDKFGGMTGVQLAARPESLNRLRQTVGVPIRILHVTRNPFDNITTISKRMGISIEKATVRYRNLCRSIAVVSSMVEPSEILHVDYDAFVASPTSVLTEICGFLGVDADPAFLADCSTVVWPKTRRTRETVDWSTEEVATVQQLVDTYPVLSHYRFED